MGNVERSTFLFAWLLGLIKCFLESRYDLLYENLKIALYQAFVDRVVKTLIFEVIRCLNGDSGASGRVLGSASWSIIRSGAKQGLLHPKEDIPVF
jgi:hypothetical protein